MELPDTPLSTRAPRRRGLPGASSTRGSPIARHGQTSSFFSTNPQKTCARHYLTLISTRAFHPVCDLPIQNMAGMSGKRNFVCSMDSLTVGLLFVLKLIVRFDIEVVVSCSFGPSEPFNPADRVS